MPKKKTDSTNLPALRGQPRKFKTEEELAQAFIDYIEWTEAKGKFANIAGFCVFCDMHRDTFYMQQEYYTDTFKKIQSALEDVALNNRNTAMGIFYLKNKFGYADKPTENSGDMVEIDLNDDDIDILLSKMGYSLLE